MTASNVFQRLLVEFSAVKHLVVAKDGCIRSVNRSFAARVGVQPGDLVGQPVVDFLTAADVNRLLPWLQGGPVPREPVRLNFVASSGAPFTLRCLLESKEGAMRIVGEPESLEDGTAVEELMRLNNELATMARERARRQRELEKTRRDLQGTVQELERSYWHLKKIQEVLPICMECGKVKTDEVKWQSLIDYLKANQIFLSHGYCPGCAEVAFREAGLEEEL